jgi:glycosyltransferase involved in cell wall biosynthesis
MVLGMHRSGTSALTRTLSLMGATLPVNLMPPVPGNNEAGFWEPQAIANLNNAMLKEAGGRWDDWRPFDFGALPEDRQEHYRGEIKNLISKEFGTSPLFVLKDPRISRLVPLYASVLAEMDVEPLFVLCNRHPGGVVASLAKRDGMTEDFGNLVWLRHETDAEAATRGLPRVSVSYEEILHDWRGAIAKIGRTLGLNWPRTVADASAEIDGHLRPDLRHHNPVDLAGTEGSQIKEWVRDAYRAMKLLESAPGDIEGFHTLDRVKRELDSGAETFGAAFFPELRARELAAELSVKSVQKSLEQAVAQRVQFEDKSAKNISTLTSKHNKELNDIREKHRADRENAAIELELANNRVVEQLDVVGQLTLQSETLKSRVHAFETQLADANSSLKKALGAVERAKEGEKLARKLHQSAIRQNDALRRSTSWRLTRPIRVLKRAMTEKGFAKFALQHLRDSLRTFFRTRVAVPAIAAASPGILAEARPDVSFVVGDLPRRGSKTIVVFAHSVSNVIFGGERSFIDVVESLSALNYDVFVVLPREVPSYSQLVKRHCCRIYFAKLPWWNSGRESDESKAEIERIVRHSDASVVYVNTIVLREPAIVARNLGIPTITHAREIVTQDQWIAAAIGSSSEEIVADVSQRSSCIVCNSSATLSCFEGTVPTVLARNAFDVTEFMGLPERSDLPLTVGLVGSLGEKKGVEDFVAVAKFVEKVRPEIRFLLVGPKSPYVTQLMDSLAADWPANIELTGYISSPVKAMQGLDVVVNLSLFGESFGRTVLEGMAAAKPVVAYNYGALGELIDDGASGFLVPFRDIAAVADRIIRLAADSDLRRKMGKFGRSLVGKQFGIERLAQDLAGAVQLVLANPVAPGNDAKMRDHRGSGLSILKPTSSVGANRDQSASRPASIAYFMWHFPVPSETFVHNELRLLVEQNHDVLVFCKNSPHPNFSLDFDIKFERVSSPEQLAERLRTTGREVVHSHFVYPTVTDMVWPACELAGIPFTFIAHSQDIFRYDNAALNRIDELSKSKLCKRVFVPSSFHLEYLENIGVPVEKLQINPNGIDTAKYSSQPIRSRLRGKRLCAVHRFTEKKGLLPLVRAMKLIADPDVKLTIHGYGPDEELLRGEIRTLGLANVEIAGPVATQHDLINVLRTSDIFLCPSVRAKDGDMDGIPTVLMEAMATGIPVITTSVAGIPDLVQDEITGFVCDGDPQSIAATIEKVLDAGERNLHEIVSNARKKVIEQFDVGKLTNNLLAVWRDYTFDIIIVSWNNLPELREVIRRIYVFTRTPFHLIICDNLSEVDVRSFLTELHGNHDNVTVVFNNENSMVGPGSNLAIAHGDSEFVVYVCGKEGFVFQYGWETELLRPFDTDARVGLVGTRCYSPSYLTAGDYKTRHPQFADFRNKNFADSNPNVIMSHVQGGLFAIRRAAFDDIGGFSEAVPHNGTDVEFSYVAESRGWRIASSSATLSLYSKTRPDLWSRIDSSVLAVHPPKLDDLSAIETILESRGSHCNVCGHVGSGGEVHSPQTYVCSVCGSTPSDRSLWKFLAESTLTHRRLGALAVGELGSLEDIWKQQFQGPRLSLPDFEVSLQGKGRIQNRSSGLDVVLFRRDPTLSYSEPWSSWLTEANRLLKLGGTLLMQPRFVDWDMERIADSSISPDEREFFVAELLVRHGFSKPERIVHASRSTQYSWWPLYSASKLEDRSRK